MPGGDGTGPAGAGPQTGRRRGYCAGYNMPGFANPLPGFGSDFGAGVGFGRGAGFGRGFGRGRGAGFGGRGRGFRWRYLATGIPGWAWFDQPQQMPQSQPQQIQPFVPIPKEQEKATLEQEKQLIEQELKAFEAELKEIKKRLSELR